MVVRLCPVCDAALNLLSEDNQMKHIMMCVHIAEANEDD